MSGIFESITDLLGFNRNIDIISADDKQSGRGLMKVKPSSSAHVFNGMAGKQNVYVLNADKLKAGKKYHFASGLLIIKGDVPKNVELKIENAKLYISGNVGDGVKITATAPQKYKIVRDIGTTVIGHQIIKRPIRRHEPDGIAYPNDKDPIVTVSGNVGYNVEINSDSGLRIDGTRQDGFVYKAGARDAALQDQGRVLSVQPAITAALRKNLTAGLFH